MYVKTMSFKVLGFLVLFAISALGEDINIRNDSTNEIPRQQISSLQKFLKLGNAYKIPEGISSFDFCNQHRSKALQDEEEVTSENYPKPYPVKKLSTLSLSVQNSMGIEVILCVLDIDPTKDYLKLSPVKDDGTLNPGMIFTGNLKEPVKLRLLQATEIKLEFGAWTKPEHKHKGYLLTYAPYGNISKTVEPPPDRKVPFDKLESYNTLLMVANKSADTWELFRELLCNASNRFIEDNKLQLENCHKENVTIKSVVKCPDEWPNSAECIDLSFAITLYALESDEIIFNPILRESRDPAGLSKEDLEKMWVRYGKAVFSDYKYVEYKTPNATGTILLWIGIGFGIVLFAVVILVAMCKLSSFRDYWPTPDDDKQNILKNSPEMDISMFPSPDQVVPPLFPMGVSGYTGEKREKFVQPNEIGSQENESLRRSNSTRYGSAFNQGFIDDEEIVRKRPNYQTYAKGVSTDEATT